jgi:hypothetical protein
MWDVHNERLLGGIIGQRNNPAAVLQESKDFPTPMQVDIEDVAEDVTRARQGLDPAQIPGLQSRADASHIRRRREAPPSMALGSWQNRWGWADEPNPTAVSHGTPGRITIGSWFQKIDVPEPPPCQSAWPSPDAPIDFQRDGKFQLTVPDFGADPIAGAPDHDGEIEIWARDKSTGDLVPLLVPTVPASSKVHVDASAA